MILIEVNKKKREKIKKLFEGSADVYHKGDMIWIRSILINRNGVKYKKLKYKEIYF